MADRKVLEQGTNTLQGRISERLIPGEPQNFKHDGITETSQSQNGSINSIQPNRGQLAGQFSAIFKTKISHI